jgi:hypothetical protein
MPSPSVAVAGVAAEVVDAAEEVASPSRGRPVPGALLAVGTAVGDAVLRWGKGEEVAAVRRPAQVEQVDGAAQVQVAEPVDPAEAVRELADREEPGLAERESEPVAPVGRPELVERALKDKRQ